MKSGGHFLIKFSKPNELGHCLIIQLVKVSHAFVEKEMRILLSTQFISGTDEARI